MTTNEEKSPNNSTTMKTEIFLHNNYCNIDAISIGTAGLLCVYVSFSLYSFVTLYSSTVWSMNKDYENNSSMELTLHLFELNVTMTDNVILTTS